LVVVVAALLVAGACSPDAGPSTKSYAFSTTCALPDPSARVNPKVGSARPGIAQTEALRRLVANSSMFAGHKPVAARLVVVAGLLRKKPTLEYEFVFNGIVRGAVSNQAQSSLTFPRLEDGVVAYFAADRATFAPDEVIESCPPGST
jgi:hypothetical protein